MGNLDMDEQIAQVRAELARVSGDIDRFTGELRVQREATAVAEWQLAQRRREFNDVDREEAQIRSRYQAVPLARASQSQPVTLPPALAALESEVDQLQARLFDANAQRERARNLWNQNILPRSELDTVESRALALSAQLASARDRLSAALVDHERRHASAGTELNVAGTQLSASQAQSASWNLQLEASQRLRASLGERFGLLERKRAQFSIAAPRQGTLFGEELPRMLGQYFAKGAEICRVADINELQVRVRIAEQELSDIREGQPVRVKARSFPDRTFQGRVSRIGGESETSDDGQLFYRVEFTIRNEDNLLRPGMTVFTRADFGRRSVAWLLAHKLRQALRPELWML